LLHGIASRQTLQETMPFQLLSVRIAAAHACRRLRDRPPDAI
jgi:hypothetical protein